MRRTTWQSIGCLVSLLSLWPTGTYAQTGADTPQKTPDAAEPLRVAVAGSAPFVIDEGEAPRGLSIDFWQDLLPHVSRTEHATFQHYDAVEDALEALERGDADVALGPISITAERATRVTFSQPYFRSSLSILAPVTESLWDRAKPFVSRAFMVGVALLLGVLVGVGTLLWLAERRVNPEQFPKSPVAGIANGVWLALVTMTTVGYGDLTPISRAGRLIAGGWMIVAMITASSLTASIATALTLSQLETPGIERASDLSRRTIAAIDPSPAVHFVRDAGGHVLKVQSVADGFEAVQSGQADALVWDRPVLAYHLKQRPTAGLSLSQSEYEPRGYGLAVQRGSLPLVHELNVGVLRLQESGKLDRIQQRWLEQ